MVRSLVLILAVVGATACVGAIGDGAPDIDQQREPQSCVGHDPLASIGSSPLQRLTRLEYANSVRDILGVVVDPATLVSDGSNGTFAGNANDALTADAVTDLHQIAMAIAERAAPQIAAADPIASYGRLLYRRPLTAEETTRLRAVYAVGVEEGHHENGVRLALATMLQSPSFLYRVEAVSRQSGETVALTGHEIASRLSYMLWKSAPDDALLIAAENGSLESPAGIRAEAARMLDDARARSTITRFHEQWLGTENLATLDRDPSVFADLTTTLPSEMATDLDQFVADAFSGDARLATLLMGELSFSSAELTAAYADVPRRGLLMHPGFLATHADYGRSSPTNRGKWVRSQLLCDATPEPPDDVAFAEKEVGDTRTQRQWLEATHLADPGCSSCHRLMDPIGFGLEHFDGIGRWRSDEEGQPIDASGSIAGADATLAAPFDGADGLVDRLASSDEVAACVAQQWWRYGLGREPSAEEKQCGMARIEADLAADGDLRALLIAITTSDSFRFRHVPEDSP